MSALVALLHQPFVKQGCDQVDGGKREIRRCATDSFCSLQRTASNKDGQAPETTLLLGIQEIITPADGITQCLLPGGSILPSTPQHGKPVVEPPEQCLWRQEFAPCCCPLQGQRPPFPTHPKLSHPRHTLLNSDKIGLHRLRTLN